MSLIDAWEDFDPTLCDTCGHESCEDHLPPAPDVASLTPRLTFSRAADLISAPPPVEIIEGVAWADCLSVLVSESGAGKTFMLLDLAAAVSSGVAWHGRYVQQGSVAYLSYEGDALGVRLQAIRDVTGHRLDHVYGTRAQDPLSPRIDRDGEVPSLGELAATAALQALSVTLRATGRPPVSLLMIDTVRASLTGSEDSSEHVSAYLRVVRRMLTSVPGAAAILAHHAGWQDGDTQRKRERGSSAWRGNCDATFYLEVGASRSESGETELTLRTLKVRDDERPAPLRLVRRVVEVPGQMNRRGDPITSCVIERDRRTREDREAERVAAVDASQRELDLLVLRAMRDYPAATSISSLRPYVSQQMEAVRGAVARILCTQLAVAGKRGQPFALTAAGLAALKEVGS